MAGFTAGGAPITSTTPTTSAVNPAQNVQGVTVPNVPTTYSGGGILPQYGTTPVTTPTTNTTPTTAAPITPQSEGDIYSSYLHQGQSIIDQINNAAAGQIAAANQNIDQGAATAQQNQNGLAAITGNFGSASVQGANTISSQASTQKATQDAQIQQQAAQQVTGYMQNLQSAAQQQANTETSEAPQYNQALQQAASTTIQGLIKLNPTLDLNTLANSSSPQMQQSYANLLQAYGGDTNALAAAWANAVPVNNVVQSWTQGSTLYQLVRNPQTNAVSVQTFDTGVNIPTGWTTTKIGTNGQFFQDPNNPANSLTLSTDPYNGGVSYSGSGTGAALAAQYNATATPAAGSTSNSNTPTNSSANDTGYINVATSTAGITDPTIPFSDALTNNGIGSIVTGIINAEGGSLPNVQNNPGNVKYVAGMAGATDSGVKATDGGTFASFSTPEAGQQAIASTLNSIAQNQGAGATVQSVLSTYAGLNNSTNSPQTQAGVGTNGLPTAEYGKLANVQGFDPTKPGVDQDALKYLQGYLSGTQPTAASLGISTRAGQGGAFDQVSQRAKDVYFQATGQNLPNISVLSDNLGLVSKNNALLNNLNVQTGVINKNFGLSLKNLDANNINQAPPFINKLGDALSQSMGSANVAQYLSQNKTLQQEIGSLLSVKNASGVTVADKVAAGDLLPSDLSASQQKAILNVLLQEATNQQQSIGSANAALYDQTDPLGLDPENPVNQPGYQELVTGAGFNDNYDGTYTAPDGSIWQADASGNVTQIQ